MHPLGCFGSTLAFDPTSQACQACSGRTDCEAKVGARHPQMQMLLSRFSDPKGEPMSVHWMTKTERQAYKAEKKARALAEAEALTYGSSHLPTQIKAGLDTRVHALVDRLSLEGINLFHAPLDNLAHSSPAMAIVLDVLRKHKRTTIDHLSLAVARRARVSSGTAQRDTYAAVSLLVSSKRAQRNRSIVELT